jgi:hypothetical protein
MLNSVYLRSSRLKVLHFWLDSCIANKGEKFELEMACWLLLEGFQVVASHFWALLHTGLTSRGHRSDRSKCWSCSHVAHRSDRWCWPVWPVRAELLQLPCFKWCFACIRPGEIALVQGELACVQGELFVSFQAWFGVRTWEIWHWQGRSANQENLADFMETKFASLPRRISCKARWSMPKSTPRT